MLSNRIVLAVARRAAVGVPSAFDGTRMSTSGSLAAHNARKPRVTDAGYAQGGDRAWSPPV